jgi:hypothetical protein
MVDFNVKDSIVLVFLSIALYNFLELHVFILSTFKSRRGLYFWSFTVSTWGVALNSIGYLLKNHAPTKPHLYSTFIIIGWCPMVTGQSVVLYSRLYLLMRNKKRLRAVLIMIITNAVWLHLPVIVLVYGSNSETPKPFERPYVIYEKLQLCVFFAQECIISGLYVWETTRLLKLKETIGNSNTSRVLIHLIYVNVIIILLDIAIMSLEFAGMYDVQTAWKPLAYSVKLKLEFSILDRLVDLIQNKRGGKLNSSSQNAPKPGALASASLQEAGGQ